MKKRRFGEVGGREVSEITLESAEGAVSILNFGCVLRDWRVDGPKSSLPMTLGFPTMEGISTIPARMGRSWGGWRTGSRTAVSSSRA